MTKPLFSVIIPTLNEEKYIGKILANLKNQTLKDFELILVDAKSSDKTTHVVKKFDKFYPIKIVSSNVKNLSYQRNLGAKEASGKYFFFIDADNTIPNNFFSSTKTFIEKKKPDAVIPKLVPENNSFFNKISYPLSIFLVKLSLSTPRPFSTGGNIIVSKDFFSQTKGFDQKVFVGEDHDMIRQLKELGVKIMLMTSTFVVFSMRRFEKEGYTTYLKYAYAFVYQIFFRKVDREIYHYKMGGDNYK